MHPNPKRIIPVILLLALVGGGGWWYFNQAAAANGGGLAASGTIEATAINVSPELGGRVSAVNVKEGDTVKAGDVLVQLDTTLLQAQRTQAQAALAAAEANYASLKDGATAAQLQANLANAEAAALSAQQALDSLNDTAAAATAQAQAAVAQARDALDKAQKNLSNVQSPDIDYYRDRVTDATNALAAAKDSVATVDVGALYLQRANAEEQLKKATDIYNDAKDALERCPACTTVFVNAAGKKMEWKDVVRQYTDATNNLENIKIQIDQIERNSSAAVEHAQDALKDAQDRLTDAQNGPTAIKLAIYQATVKVAQEQLALAETNYAKVQAGPNVDQLAAAQARLAGAQATLKATQAALAPAQLAAVKAQRDTAQAAVDLLDVQLKKLTLVAPADGVVLSRAIEPGEMASPGAVLLVIGQLQDLTITVYVPEDRYGQIMLGQQAAVSADSFPGQAFPAAVAHIADKAEFTPRNVQTVDGRKTTVFAVKLSIDNRDGKLKPGMPADVKFGE